MSQEYTDRVAHMSVVMRESVANTLPTFFCARSLLQNPHVWLSRYTNDFLCWQSCMLLHVCKSGMHLMAKNVALMMSDEIKINDL